MQGPFGVKLLSGAFYEYQSEFARTYCAQGLERGLEQGHETGLRAAVHELLQVKLGQVTADDEAAIAAVHSGALVELVGALGRASSAEEARAAIAACRSRT